MYKVFVDGSAGTTGLRIVQRLSERKDVFLIRLDENRRKDPAARKEALNDADVAFLCLPDEAAQESARLIENRHTAVIDTSTAHRVSEGWVYGFAEIGCLREMISSSKRIANPGCHASGFIALVAPLVEYGLIARSEKLSCLSLTGYSGGGKKMIAQYEDGNRDILLNAPRMYGLNQTHKHLSEMRLLCGLEHEPVFCPVVAPYYAGMEVTVPVTGLRKKDVEDAYRTYYHSGRLVRFREDDSENGFLSASAMAGRDDMTVTVFGNDERMILTARFDNLGKGASGAALQNMNILLGLDEALGLITE